jgi:hypothetical protein
LRVNYSRFVYGIYHRILDFIHFLFFIDNQNVNGKFFYKFGIDEQKFLLASLMSFLSTTDKKFKYNNVDWRNWKNKKKKI